VSEEADWACGERGEGRLVIVLGASCRRKWTKVFGRARWRMEVAQRSVSAVKMEEGGRRSSDTVEIEDGGRQRGGRGGECRDERCYGAAMAGGWRVGVGHAVGCGVRASVGTGCGGGASVGTGCDSGATARARCNGVASRNGRTEKMAFLYFWSKEQ
jgi:hypothetical protein